MEQWAGCGKPPWISLLNSDGRAAVAASPPYVLVGNQLAATATALAAAAAATAAAAAMAGFAALAGDLALLGLAHCREPAFRRTFIAASIVSLGHCSLLCIAPRLPVSTIAADHGSPGYR
jgi:hypothetical protein